MKTQQKKLHKSTEKKNAGSKNEQSLSDPCDDIKQSNLFVIRAPEKKGCAYKII